MTTSTLWTHPTRRLHRPPDPEGTGPDVAGPLGSVARRRRTRAHLLLVVAAVAAAGTTLVPGVLQGNAAMNGSARGTAVVVLLLAAPLAALAGRGAARGSLRAELVAAGADAYLTYNAVLFVFATPLDRAFPAYVALLGLGVWCLADRAVAAWTRADGRADGRAVAGPRWPAVYLGLVVLLNAAAWTARILPTVLTGERHAALDGTGLPTNPVIAEDLATWLPVMAWLAVGVWRRHPPRVALAAAGTVFWVVEAVGVAVDQWWAHAADPGSPVASAAAVPAFLLLAVVGLAPARALLRAAAPDDPPVLVVPGSRRATAAIGVLAALNAVAAAGGAWGLVSGRLALGDTVTARLPWGSPAVGGVALLVAVAVPQAVLALLAASRDRRTPAAAVAAGVALIAWIAVELAFVRELSVLHPVYVAIGWVLVELGVRAAAPERSGHEHR